MKSNDINKIVRIIKAGMFNGFEGKIVSIKAQVDLGSLGIWGFDFSDIEETNKIAIGVQISPVKELSDENDKVVSYKEKPLLKTPKIVKVKKVKTNQSATKRKYTKKQTNEQ